MLQVTPASGSAIGFIGTFLLGWAFFGFTIQIAASYFLDAPPWSRAFIAGIVPAAVTMALIRMPPPVIIGVGLIADAAAVRAVYDVDYRTTALMVVVHYAAAIALTMLGVNLYTLL